MQVWRAEEAYSFLVRKGVVLTKVTYTSLVGSFSKETIAYLGLQTLRFVVMPF
jgi:hypothetical protein